jgi:membrane-associated phospholipid phosphatase
LASLLLFAGGKEDARMATATGRLDPAVDQKVGFMGMFGFLAGVILLAAAIALALIVKSHPAPLPNDVQIELADQRLLLPHHQLATALDQVSRVNWPTPAGAIVGGVFALLLVMRRFLDALTAAGASVLGDLSSYLTNQFVQRPRPTGHGIVVLKQITNYFGFPSGHVVHVVAFFGVLLFLTFQTKRWPAVRWLLRIMFVLLIVLIGPSRVMEGEHWPSDVVEGLIIGAFWLLAALHFYWWGAQHWPRLLAPDERDGNAESRRVFR